MIDTDVDRDETRLTDVARAKEIIRNTARLDLKIVEAGPTSTKEALLQSYAGKVPEDMEVISGAGSSGGDTGTVFYLVRKVAAVTGQDLRGAKPTIELNSGSIGSNSALPGGWKNRIRWCVIVRLPGRASAALIHLSSFQPGSIVKYWYSTVPLAGTA